MYSYEKEKPELHTDNGIKLCINAYARAKELCKTSGVCQIEGVINGLGGSSWTQLAAVDFLVQHGFFRIAAKGHVRQHDIIQVIR